MEKHEVNTRRRLLGFKRTAGLDRSGPPPVEIRNDQPWRPWTLPNLVDYIRLVLIVPFFVLSWNSPDGSDTTALIFAAAAGFGDYLDGIVARLTGQYSRLGALLDPLVDRLLILAAAAVIWKFELVPRPLIDLLVLREVATLVMSLVAFRMRIDVKINWIGRLSVWPLMLGGLLAMATSGEFGVVLVGIGVAGAYLATLSYAREVLPKIRQVRMQDLNPN